MTDPQVLYTQLKGCKLAGIEGAGSYSFFFENEKESKKFATFINETYGKYTGQHVKSEVINLPVLVPLPPNVTPERLKQLSATELAALFSNVDEPAKPDESEAFRFHKVSVPFICFKTHNERDAFQKSLDHLVVSSVPDDEKPKWITRASPEIMIRNLYELAQRRQRVP